MTNPRIISDYGRGETVEITVYALDRDGATVIPGIGAGSLRVTIGETENDTPTYSFTSSPQITLVSAGTGRYQVALQPSDISSLVPGTRYYMNIWVDVASRDILLWSGPFILRPTVI